MNTKDVSRKIRSAAAPAMRHARRAGWVVEDKLDEGIRIVRGNPRKSGAAVIGFIAIAALVVLACRKKSAD